MHTELQQFNQERAERIRLLREKHEKQLEAFDEESARMGFT
jgi:thousand and one amino acid protein kinase